MQIFSLTDSYQNIWDGVRALVAGPNILAIIGVVGLAVAVHFVTRFFTKSTDRIKA